jgi:aerobic-type carbon monoxide dehydrogenase small subunit (CoxS/CutS family)
MANIVVSTHIQARISVNGEEVEGTISNQMKVMRLLQNELRMIVTNDGFSNGYCGARSNLVASESMKSRQIRSGY